MNVKGRRMVIAVLVVVLLIASVTVIAISMNGNKAVTSSAGASVVDANGSNISLAAPPQRIVSCSPGATQIAYAIDMGSNVVAVTTYDDYPAAAVKLVDDNQTIGGYWNPSVESIIGYSPNLVIVTQGAGDYTDLITQLNEVNIPVLTLYPGNNLTQVYWNIEMVGKLCDRSSVANQVVTNMENNISAVSKGVSSVTNKENVLYVEYVDPGFTDVWTTGNDTAVSQIISLAGGNNVLGNYDWSWEEPSPELFVNISSSIDVIMVTSMNSTTTPTALLSSLQTTYPWSSTPAVKDNKVFFLNGQGEDIFNEQTVRMDDAVQITAEMLYPDLFTAKVLYDPTGQTPNVISDNYTNYLPSGETLSGIMVDPMNTMQASDVIRTWV